MKRRRSLRPCGRLARLGALGLLAGAIAGAAAAGDIEKSYRKGRIAPAVAAAAAPEPAFAAEEDEFGLAASHGYTLAASLRFASRDECRTLAPAMRPGCLDYFAQRAAGAMDAESDDLF